MLTFIIGLFLCLLLTEVRGKTVCYEPYGCFSNRRPFNNLRGNLPDSPAKQGLKFLLYTKSNKDTPEDLSPLEITTSYLESSKFVNDAKTVFIIHGFSDNGSSEWVMNMKNELLKLADDMNVIVVDWSKGASVGYYKAGANTRIVGVVSAYIVKRLHYVAKMKYQKFHIIGHDLGAQAAGFAGEKVPCISRITGLDPSGFAFQRRDKKVKLDSLDAEYVDVIHTNGGWPWKAEFGTNPRYRVGTVDFYVNGGVTQPGCEKIRVHFRNDFINGRLKDMTKVACSHMRAVEYFTNSINKCYYEAHDCPNGPIRANVIMGYHSVPGVQGKFCLETQPTEPFCEKSSTRRSFQSFMQHLYT